MENYRKIILERTARCYDCNRIVLEGERYMGRGLFIICSKCAIKELKDDIKWFKNEKKKTKRRK